jgi:ribosomal-protein-serine acetyltransferase
MLYFKVDENLEMRLVSERYAEEGYRVVRDNLEYLHEWLPWATEAYTVESAREFMRTALERFGREETLTLLIFFQNRFSGCIGFNKPDYVNKSTEIGYWQAADVQGNGIMTKCCRAVIDHCFGELDLNRIVIRCATGNRKSQAIPERLGFSLEGIEREAEWLHGKFVSLKVYSMLKKEWEEQ